MSFTRIWATKSPLVVDKVFEQKTLYLLIRDCAFVVRN